MTAIPNYQPYYEVLVRVGRVREGMRAVRVAAGALGFVAAVCGVVLAVTLLQGFVRFGPTGRAALLVCAAATVGLAFWRGLVRPIRDDTNDKEVARLLETRLPSLGNDLINTLLLAEGAEGWSPVLVERAISEAAADARGVDLDSAVSRRPVKRRALAAAGAVAALVLWAGLAPGRFVSAGLQVLSPFGDVASVGSVRFASVQPGTTEWTKGEPMDIVAVLEDTGGRGYSGVVEVDSGGEVERKALLRTADGPERFTHRIPQVLVPFGYRLTVGGTESEWFGVTLREPALVEGLDLTYTYPAYTGRPPHTERDAPGEIRCVAGTQVTMTIRMSAPVAGGTVLFASGKEVPCTAEEGGRRLRAQFGVFEDDTYRIHLAGRWVRGAAVVYRIVALPDEPPTVAFTVPGRDVVASPGETVRLALKAADGYGLGSVRVLARGEAEAEAREVARWDAFADPREALLSTGLEVEAAAWPAGSVVVYWAEARDRRTYQGGATPKGPNVATTPKFKVAVEDRAAASEKRLDQLSHLYERLSTILKAQQEARAGTEAAREAGAAGADLEAAQRAIRADTQTVTVEVEFDARSTPIKRVLLVLVANEMTSAVAKAKALASAGTGESATALADALAADQDAIIAALRQILEIVPDLTDAVREEQASRDPSDMPPEALERLKQLLERLKEFADAQKRVIEASKDLVKKPVDDFTDADQRELERLKAIEDDWDKFLAELISDLSKVPLLDASNPSLVRELIEVKTDVEMAADALAKQATDIVVPLEELALEGAEELVHNLERWLPDTPDRDAWQQEEALSETEVPHAELPEEMEDLVGDLLEEEEDLFEEIEDTTSGAADSIDAGAGWDAMDGPISSFSAKGVTGNRLPNTSEIGGRSGEGRTGKSSGEFVEETATGKGGRRTPTRLTPDAFSEGEVADQSDEAPTGATGGGKVSGAGGEGLEGPVPPELQRRMGRLAGRQAQLRNRAEGVKAALEVRNYESFGLDDAIEGMRRVQRDLLAGRYRSALRQRHVVLQGLKGTKMLLGGEIRIRRDSGAALPDAVREDILDALEKPMPPGYEAYLKRYYERLSEGS